VVWLWPDSDAGCPIRAMATSGDGGTLGRAERLLGRMCRDA
jgi:hypothetical protein